ncbi:MAG TPA: MBL fold metallo-hydrolase, partial [Ideonella sp.]|nr:MBL fold metallo-hydrolase [Ideonella sp.]
IGRRHAQAAQRHDVLKRELAALYAAGLADHGVTVTPAVLELIALDIELNAQGMGIWLDREARQQRAPA